MGGINVGVQRLEDRHAELGVLRASSVHYGGPLRKSKVMRKGNASPGLMRLCADHRIGNALFLPADQPGAD